MNKKLLVVIALLAILMAGCSTQKQLLATSIDAYTTTLNSLSELREAGLIDDETAARIEKHRVVARNALDSWWEAIKKFDEAMSELRKIEMEAGNARD